MNYGRNLIQLIVGLVLFLSSCKSSSEADPAQIIRMDTRVLKWIESDFTKIPFDPTDSSFQNIYCTHVWQVENNLHGLQHYFANKDLEHLARTTVMRFDNLSSLEKEIGVGLSRLHHDYPKVSIPPRIYGCITGLQQPIFIANDFLAIGLDNYLGADANYYEGYFEEYACFERSPEFIARDLMRMLLEDMHPYSGQSILDWMIYEGLMIYQLQQLLPSRPIELIFGYTNAQLEWCRQQEKQMWFYLLKMNYLYSEDTIALKTLTTKGPFTNDFGEESPAQAIKWIGYQIVNLYFKSQSTPIDSVWSINGRELLRISKYK